jgi:hypothetical protein
VTRQEFQQLAADRIGDAEALLQADRFSCAYHIGGYAVECALKACIAGRTRQDDFPPRDAVKYYTHDVGRLLEIAGLAGEHAEYARQNATFKDNWDAVREWTEEARYQTFTQEQAANLLTAIADPENGVLEWLKRSW